MNEFFLYYWKLEKPNPLLSNEFELGSAMGNFSFKAVSEKDGTNVRMKMKTSHGSGCDGIASFFIKIALPFISGSLCNLFNLSLSSGKFPTDWKIARVVVSPRGPVLAHFCSLFT